MRGAVRAGIGLHLPTGAEAKVSVMPEVVRVIFEDIYAQGISHSFLIAVPFAVVSLIAVLFLPNKPLTRMTTSERIQASEADLATVSVAEGMDSLTATADDTRVTATADAAVASAGEQATDASAEASRRR
jgi:CTP:molybdopterin cytidylyltransferase MocA